jgi:hypothetical protein
MDTVRSFAGQREKSSGGQRGPPGPEALPHPEVIIGSTVKSRYI